MYDTGWIIQNPPYMPTFLHACFRALKDAHLTGSLLRRGQLLLEWKPLDQYKVNVPITLKMCPLR